MLFFLNPRFLFFALSLWAVTGGRLGAQIDISWIATSGGNDDWTLSSNWSSSNVPDLASERAVFDTNGLQTSVDLNQSETVGGIRFESGLTDTLSINGAGVLTLDQYGLVNLSDTTVTFGVDIDATDSGTWQIDSTSGEFSFVGNTVTVGASGLVLDAVQAGNTFNFSGDIVGSGGLTKNGDGTLILNAQNTYTGGTVVNDGKLVLTIGGPVGAIRGSLTINNGAEVETTALDPFGYSSGTRVTEVSIDGGTLTNSNLDTQANGNLGWGVDYKLRDGATMSSNGGVSTTATGTENFTMGEGGSVQATAGTSTIAGRIDFRSDSGSNYDFTVDTGAALNVTAGITNTDSQSQGNVAGFTKLGGGTMTLSGASTYGGETTVSAGTLVISDDAALGAVAGDTTVSAGATLVLQGDLTVGAGEYLTLAGSGISGGGALRNGSGDNTWEGRITLTDDAEIETAAGSTLTLGGQMPLSAHALTFESIGDTTVNGQISGAGSLTKNGVGTLTLNGKNFHAGGTVVNDGKLTLGVGGTVGAIRGSLTINAGAEVETTALDPFGYSSGTRVTEVVIDGGTLTNSNLDTQTNGNLGWGVDYTLRDGATMSSNGGVSTTATGTENFTMGEGGSVHATAGTSTIAGRIDFRSDSGSNYDFEVDTGANLNITAGITNTDSQSQGSVAGFTKLGGGTMTLSGANTYEGETTVSAGTLVLGDNNALGATSGDTTVSAGATLSLQGGLTVGSGEYLFISGSGVADGGALRSESGTNIWGGRIVMSDDTKIETAAGSTLTLNHRLNINDYDLTVDSIGDTIINERMEGIAGGLIKRGSGTLTLGLLQLYGGATSVEAGTLQLNAADILPDVSTVSVASGATLNLGFDETFASLSGAGEVSLGAGTFTTDFDSISSTFSGVISGLGGLTKAGTGSQTLSGANTYSGATDINAGTLLIGHDTALGDGSGNTSVLSGSTLALQGDITVTSDGSLSLTGQGVSGGGALRNESGDNIWNGDITTTSFPIIHTVSGTSLTINGNILTSGPAFFDSFGSTTVNGVISGNALTISKSGSGLLVLSGNNTFSGITSISGGTLRLGISDAIPDTSDVIFSNGGTFDLAGFSETVGSLDGLGNVMLSSAGTLTTGVNNGDTTLSGIVSGTGGLVKIGSGNQSLTGANTYSGATAINAGTLSIGHNTALGATGGGTQVFSGASLILQNNITVGAGELLTLAGSGVSGGGALQNEVGDNNWNGNITLSAGTEIQTDSGSSLTMNGAISNGGHDLTFDAIGTTVATGGISGAGDIIKNSAGALTLSGASTYSGNTSVNAGTLFVGHDTALGDTSGDTTVESGASIGLQGGITVGAGESLSLVGFGDSATGGGALRNESGNNTWNGDLSIDGLTIVRTNSGSSLDLNAVDMTTARMFFDSIGDTTVNGVISGTGGISKSGAGILTLSGANTYFSTHIEAEDYTSITGGTLRLGSSHVIPDTSDVRVSGGGTFDLAGYNEAVASIEGAGAVTLGSGTLATGVSNEDTTFAGVISGTGGIQKTGTGTFTVSGANTYTGETTISSGILRLGNSGVMADASDLTVEVVGTLDLAGHDETIGSLAGGGSVTLGSGTLSTGGSDTSTSFSGIISGTGGLTKTGTGTQTLTGANTYSGATAITAGTLMIGSDDALGDVSGDTTVSTGATLALQNGVAVAAGESLSLAGSGASGSGALRSTSGNNIWNGAITLTDDSKIETASGSTLSLTADIATSGHTIEFSSSGDTTVTGMILGAGDLQQSGTGTLTLSGSNTYTGGTNIAAGTLQLGSSDVIVDTSNFTVSGPGIFDLAGHNEAIGSLSGDGSVTLGAGTLTTSAGGTSATFSGVLSGTGGLTKTGTGTQTLTGANTYTGVTAINAGTLVIGHDSALGAVSGDTTVLSGATLALQGGITVDSGESLSLAGFGASGSEVLGALRNESGDNTWSGDISISSNTVVRTDSGSSLNLNGIDLGSADMFFFSDGDTTVNGEISGPGEVSMSGNGTLTLSGTNTYTGDTSIIAGTLELGSSDVIADTSDFTISAAGTFDLAGYDETIGSLAGSGDVTLGSGTLSSGVSNSASSFSGAISGAGGLTKTGTNTLTLSGANTYTGETTITAGTLQLGSSDVIADASDFTISSSGTFDLAGNNETIGSLAGSGDVTLGASSLTIGASDNTATFSGIISGPGGLTKTGTGTQSLSGANTYTGATTVTAGTLLISDDSALGTTSDTTTVSTGATLALGGGIMVAAGESLLLAGTGASGSGALRNDSGNNTWSGAITLTDDSKIETAASSTLSLTGDITNAGHTLEFSSVGDTTVTSVISGSGGLQQSGTGTLTLSGSNTYTGGTNIAAGTLQLGSSNLIVDSSDFTISSPGTFDLAGNNQTIGSLAGSGNVTLGTGTLTTGGSNTSTTFSGNISGTGGLTKTGTGTQTLTGNNTYTGTTTVADTGTLALGASSVLADTTDLAFTGAGTFDVGAFTETIDDMVGAGTLRVANGGALTIDKLGGALDGSGDATGAFTGTLDIDGVLTLNGGIIGTGADGAGSSGTLEITAGNTLEIAADFTFGTVGTAGGGNQLGTLTLNDGATLHLSGESTVALGTLHITGDSIINFSDGEANTLALGSLTFAEGATLLIEGWGSHYDLWTAENFPGATLDQRGGPTTNITFADFSNQRTLWTSSDFGNNEITVPEPSTYGALLMAFALGIYTCRRPRRLELG